MSSSTHKTSVLVSDMEAVKKVFTSLDTNGDGKISGEELAGLMKALGSDTSAVEVKRMMEEMDTDKDGVVTLQEFADFCNRKVDDDDTELRDAFEMYDQDKNGLISASELHLVLTRLGQTCSIQDCAKMIQTVDSDGDAHVSFNEFRTMMSKS